MGADKGSPKMKSPWFVVPGSVSALIVMFLIFLTALGTVVGLTRVLPLASTTKFSDLPYPHDVPSLRNLQVQLQSFTSNYLFSTLLMFGSFYWLKQTFSLPGSALLNMAAGAIFGVPLGIVLVSLLTVAGASCCYLLSAHLLGKSLLSKLINKERITKFETEINRQVHKGSLLYYLLFIRVFPFTPNWFINLCSPLVNVPYWYFAVSVFVGLFPYNFITVQAGGILAHVQSVAEVMNIKTVASLFCLALLALVPVCCKGRCFQSNTTDVDGFKARQASMDKGRLNSRAHSMEVPDARS